MATKKFVFENVTWRFQINGHKKIHIWKCHVTFSNKWPQKNSYLKTSRDVFKQMAQKNLNLKTSRDVFKFKFFVAIYLKTSCDVFKFFLSTDWIIQYYLNLKTSHDVFKFKFFWAICLKTSRDVFKYEFFCGHLFENVTWRFQIFLEYWILLTPRMKHLRIIYPWHLLGIKIDSPELFRNVIKEIHEAYS